MQNELSSNVYESTQQSEDEIVGRHKSDLKAFGVECSADNESLPFIYSTIKQHRNPVSNRFIVSEKKCSTNALSRCLLKVFQLVAKTMKTHSRYKCKFSNTKGYWVMKVSKNIRTDYRYTYP